MCLRFLYSFVSQDKCYYLAQRPTADAQNVIATVCKSHKPSHHC